MYESVMTAISTVGFPIAITCYLLYRETKQAESRSEEMTGFIKAINNNTMAIKRLCDKMGAEGDVEDGE